MKRILLAASFLTASVSVASEVTLVGVYNNLAQGRVSIPGTDISRIKGFGPVNLTLPVTIQVAYPGRGPKDANGKILRGEPFLITLAQAPRAVTCESGITVTAKMTVEGYPDSEKTVCVPDAVSSIPGKRAFQFRNLLFAIKDNPGASENELPFKFGISAWTSSKKPWDQRSLAQTPDKKRTFPTPLRVLQGYSTWGGGNNPRMFHGHIQHVYNETPYTLFIRRDSTDSSLFKYNFQQLIPPYCAVPWASVWIPKSADATDGSNSVRIYALRPPATVRLQAQAVLVSVGPNDSKEERYKAAEAVYKKLLEASPAGKTETTGTRPPLILSPDVFKATVAEATKLDPSISLKEYPRITRGSTGGELALENDIFRITRTNEVSSNIILTNEGYVIPQLLGREEVSINLPPGFSSVVKANTSEIGADARGVDDILKSMEAAMPDFVAEVTGQPDLSDLIASQKRFYIGNFVYLLTGDNANRSIVINRCVNKEAGECTTVSTVPDATMPSGVPKYFNLFVTQDNTYGIALELTPGEDENPN